MPQSIGTLFRDFPTIIVKFNVRLIFSVSYKMCHVKYSVLIKGTTDRFNVKVNGRMLIEY